MPEHIIYIKENSFENANLEINHRSLKNTMWTTFKAIYFEYYFNNRAICGSRIFWKGGGGVQTLTTNFYYQSTRKEGGLQP